MVLRYVTSGRRKPSETNTISGSSVTLFAGFAVLTTLSPSSSGLSALSTASPMPGHPPYSRSLRAGERSPSSS